MYIAFKSENSIKMASSRKIVCDVLMSHMSKYTNQTVYLVSVVLLLHATCKAEKSKYQCYSLWFAPIGTLTKNLHCLKRAHKLLRDAVEFYPVIDFPNVETTHIRATFPQPGGQGITLNERPMPEEYHYLLMVISIIRKSLKAS